MEYNDRNIEINPFNITKAVDYTDEDIENYWVDLSRDQSFIDILKPSSPMPLFLLGGKGSGKTHIMRYYSFNLQKIRNKSDFKNGILQDGYLGVFLRCGGLNAHKFGGSLVNNEGWKIIFSYYLELWFAQLLLTVLIETIALADLNDINERIICKEICLLFDVDNDKEFLSFKELNDYLSKLQKEVDYRVNNSIVLGEKPKIDIKISSGKLIFGIPKIIQKRVDFFKTFKFLFLVDEYENLEEYQQQYINTLIREREDPVSFRIGARWYGVKTYQTFSGNESLILDAEYEDFVIDNWLRKDPQKYKKFAKNIVFSRIKKAGLQNVLSRYHEISNWFESFNFGDFSSHLSNLEESVSKSYFVKLKKKLEKDLCLREDIDLIIGNLKNSDVLIERTNVFYFYKLWKKSGNHLNNSLLVKAECARYLSKKEGELAKILEKFKGDIIDTLHREARITLPYYGLDKIIHMSSGIPRHLLIMLKHIFRWSVFKDEKPSIGNKISKEAQVKGVLDASKWFYENTKGAGRTGENMVSSISKIGRLIQLARFSDVPPECSLSSISLNPDFINSNQDVSNLLVTLEQYTYLIKIDKLPVNRSKNSISPMTVYQINGMLAPKWDLALYRRGRLQIEEDEVNRLFTLVSNSAFEDLLNNRKIRYNAPFRTEYGHTLFSEI